MTEFLFLLMVVRGIQVPPFFFQMEEMKWEQRESVSNCNKCLTERMLHW